MRYQDILIENYFENLKSSQTKNYYSTLLGIAYDLVAAEKKSNLKLKKRLDKIKSITTPGLNMNFYRAEALYFDFTKYCKSYSGKIEVVDNCYGNVKTVTYLDLKEALTSALAEISVIITELCKKYNYQRGEND